MVAAGGLWALRGQALSGGPERAADYAANACRAARVVLARQYHLPFHAPARCSAERVAPMDWRVRQTVPIPGGASVRYVLDMEGPIGAVRWRAEHITAERRVPDATTRGL